MQLLEYFCIDGIPREPTFRVISCKNTFGFISYLTSFYHIYNSFDKEINLFFRVPVCLISRDINPPKSSLIMLQLVRRLVFQLTMTIQPIKVG